MTDKNNQVGPYGWVEGPPPILATPPSPTNKTGRGPAERSLGAKRAPRLQRISDKYFKALRLQNT